MNKKTPYSINWELISRYLSGEMEKSERLSFEEQVKANPEYSSLVNKAMGDWETVARVYKQDQVVDTDHAWAHLKNRIEQENLLEKPKVNPVLQLPTWGLLIRVAAMLVIVFGLGLISYQIVQQTNLGHKTLQTAYLEGGKTLTLEDGSKIILNGNSRLIYPARFSKQKRRVELRGEAFFEITPDVSRPFIIVAGNAKVQVLGTAFNVNATDEKVEVFVTSGKVSLFAKNNPAGNVILEKDDFGTLQQNQLQKSMQPDVNYMAWKTRRLVFKKEKLNEVARIINRAYQVQVTFNDESLKELLLTSTFDHEPLEIILESLAKAFHLTYERDGPNIRFQKKI